MVSVLHEEKNNDIGKDRFTIEVKHLPIDVLDSISKVWRNVKNRYKYFASIMYSI